MIIPIIIIAAAVQIIVESLPLSSSGHVLLTFLYKAPDLEFTEGFNALAHLPTLGIITLIFWKEWFPLLRRFLNILYRKMQGQPLQQYQKTLLQLCFTIAGFVVSSNLITLGFEQFFKSYKKNLTPQPIVLLVGFMITMILLFSLKFKQKTKQNYKPLTLTKALIIGMIQGCALIPGISRFASTFVVANWLDISPRRSLQYSVLLQTTIILGVIGRFVAKTTPLSHQELFLLSMPKNWMILIGATILGYLGFMLTRQLALTQKFWLFGFYMIAPISFLLLWLR